MTTNTTEEHPKLVTPESVALYLQEPPPESHDFDFLLGEWDAQATRYGPDGEVLLRHAISWVARSVGGGRMIIDETTGVLPDGREVSHMATLRTYSPVTQRWEMMFLAALQPPIRGAFYGSRVGDEMHLRAEGTDAEGREIDVRVRFYDISADRFLWEQEIHLADRWIRDVVIEARRH